MNAPRSSRGLGLLTLAALLAVSAALPSRAAAQCALERTEVSQHQSLPDFVRLGETIDLSGDRLASGVYDEWVFPPGSDVPIARGTVYVHRRVGDAWEFEQRLFVEGIGNGDAFAYTVALEGDVLAVGVPSACVGDPIAGACDPGFVLVYERGARGWEIVQTVQPEDPKVDDVFGESIDLSGDRMIVGAYGHTDVIVETPGAAYVFERVGGTFVQVAKLEGTSGDAMALFGMGVAIDGDVAAVAAPGEPTSLPDTGALYVFERLGRTWTQTARLELPHERGAFQGARVSVDVSDRRIALGSWQADQVDFFLPELVDGLRNGAAFVVEEVGGAWTHTATLRAGDAIFAGAFGASVDVEGDRIVVGASQATGPTAQTGAAYLFESTPLGWAQKAKFFAPDALQAAFSVDLDGDLLAFGAPGTDIDGILENGAVYTGRVSELPCPGQSLQGSNELLSMGDGGSQVLAVQAGPAFAGRTYLLVGNGRFTAPPMTLPALLPGMPSAKFFKPLQLAGGPFVAGLGVLDADGAATARFDLLPGAISGSQLFGFAIHNTALIHDPAVGGFVGATNSVRLRLIP